MVRLFTHQSFNMFKKDLDINGLIVHGVCPLCEQFTPLVSIFENIYKCTNCGNELEQKVNGVIKYLPMASVHVKKMFQDGKES